jgi:hypothetical protein
MITDDFAAYAVGVDVHLHGPLRAVHVQEKVESLLVRIARECADAGAYLIGHIKCVVDAQEKGMLAVSTVDAAGQPHSRGSLEDGAEVLEIIFNVLLYGLTREKVQRIVDPLVREGLSFPGANLRIEDLGKGHHHEHDHEHH